MKKLLGILVLSLIFYINPIMIKDSNAVSLDGSKDPLEICMDRVVADKWNVDHAARSCTGKESD